MFLHDRYVQKSPVGWFALSRLTPNVLANMQTVPRRMSKVASAQSVMDGENDSQPIILVVFIVDVVVEE